MSILKKKRFLIPAGVLLVLAGAAVAVFWPYFSAQRRVLAAIDGFENESKRAEAEFPEIVDYQEFLNARAPASNGWPKLQAAYKKLKGIESKGKKGWIHDAKDYVEYRNGEPNITAMRRYLAETQPVFDVYKQALNYEFIDPTSKEANGRLSLTEVREIMMFPLLRAEMHHLCGDFDQAKTGYFVLLNLYSIFKCDSNMLGLMVHVAYKTSGITYMGIRDVVRGSKRPQELLSKAIEYSELQSADPYASLLGELAFGHERFAQFMEEYLGDDWDTGLELCDEEGNFGWYRGWEDMAGETELQLAWFKTTIDAVIALRDNPIDYYDLKAIADLGHSVDQKDEFLEGFRTSENIVSGAMLAPLRLKIHELNLKLSLLEVQSGSLLANKSAVEALVKKLLPQFHVVWEEENDDDTNSCWMEETIFKVSAQPKYSELFGDYNLPELEYVPLKKSESSSE